MTECECCRVVVQHIKALKCCILAGFTRLISGLLLVAYLKMICWSEMPYNVIPQNIREVFNYEGRTTFTWIMEKTQRLLGEV